MLEAVVGIAVCAVIGYGVPPLLRTTEFPTEHAVGYGLVRGILSGVAGIVAFAVAVALRVRRARSFGLRWAGWRSVLIGIGVGILVWIVARALTIGYTAVFGAPDNVQATYQTAAQGGPAALLASTLFLAVVTPLGEELFFRGVITTVLLRWGRVSGVLGSALVFTAFHGLTGWNITLLTAFVEGLAAAELFRRTGSIWPGVAVHVTNNAISNVISAALA